MQLLQETAEDLQHPNSDSEWELVRAASGAASVTSSETDEDVNTLLEEPVRCPATNPNELPPGPRSGTDGAAVLACEGADLQLALCIEQQQQRGTEQAEVEALTQGFSRAVSVAQQQQEGLSLSPNPPCCMLDESDVSDDVDQQSRTPAPFITKALLPSTTVLGMAVLSHALPRMLVDALSSAPGSDIEPFKSKPADAPETAVSVSSGVHASPTTRRTRCNRRFTRPHHTASSTAMKAPPANVNEASESSSAAAVANNPEHEDAVSACCDEASKSPAPTGWWQVLWPLVTAVRWALPPALVAAAVKVLTSRRHTSRPCRLAAVAAMAAAVAV